jgi:transcriptional regulator with XRE-family HTH domain
MLTGAQIRAARGLLGWNQKKLAEKAELGFATVQRAERHEATIRGMIDTVIKLQSALEEAGIEFIDAADDKGPGVRLAHRPDGG